MFETSRLNFVFLRAFYVEDKESIGLCLCLWRCGCRCRGIVIGIFISLVIGFSDVNRVGILDWSTAFLEKRIEFLDTDWLNIAWHVPAMKTSTSLTNLVIGHWLTAFVTSRSCIPRKDYFPAEFAVVSLLAYTFELALLSGHLLELVVIEAVHIGECEMAVWT